MRENLSAPGTVGEWLQITKKALTNLGYHNIERDPKFARLSARYGYDDYIVVNLRRKGDDKTLLEFDVSRKNMIQQFKTASAQVIRQMQRDYNSQKEREEFGDNYVSNVEEYPKEPLDTSDYTAPAYVGEEGDYIERTRYLPDETLTLKEYHEGIDQYEKERFKHKFERIFNRLWLIWLMLFLLPPFGIFLIWYFHRMKLFSRLFVSVVFFLYFVLIWIGFLGIDTGFNRESIQQFYNNQQYRITRFFNQNDSTTEPILPDENAMPFDLDRTE